MITADAMITVDVMMITEDVKMITVDVMMITEDVKMITVDAMMITVDAMMITVDVKMITATCLTLLHIKMDANSLSHALSTIIGNQLP